MSIINGLGLNEWLMVNHQRMLDNVEYHCVELLMMVAPKNNYPCILCGSECVRESIGNTRLCRNHANYVLEHRRKPYVE